MVRQQYWLNENERIHCRGIKHSSYSEVSTQSSKQTYNIIRWTWVIFARVLPGLRWCRCRYSVTQQGGSRNNSQAGLQGGDTYLPIGRQAARVVGRFMAASVWLKILVFGRWDKLGGGGWWDASRIVDGSLMPSCSRSNGSHRCDRTYWGTLFRMTYWIYILLLLYTDDKAQSKPKGWQPAARDGYHGDFR